MNICSFFPQIKNQRKRYLDLFRIGRLVCCQVRRVRNPKVLVRPQLKQFRLEQKVGWNQELEDLGNWEESRGTDGGHNEGREQVQLESWQDWIILVLGRNVWVWDLTRKVDKSDGEIQSDSVYEQPQWVEDEDPHRWDSTLKTSEHILLWILKERILMSHISFSV